MKIQQFSIKPKRASLAILAILLISTACQPLSLPDVPTPVQEQEDVSATDTATPSVFSAGSDSLGDSLYPLMGNGGYDVAHYTLDLNVDVANNVLDATAIIKATAIQPLSAFNLDFHGLTIEQITVTGQAATFTRADDELTITPSMPIAEADIFTVTVDYGGTPTTIRDLSAPTAIGWHHYDGGIYVVSEPAGAKTWFPNNNHPLDKATYTFRITTAAEYTTAATGILTQFIDNVDSVTTVWEMDDPMASYLSAIYIGDYIREESEGPNGLLIRNYFPPDLSEKAKQPFAATARIIEFYNDLFGPYPFDAYGSIVIDQNLGYALENQTLSVHGRNTIDLYIIAHEIMHQWTGNHVSLGDWQDIWLNEGFAFYLPFLYLDAVGEVDIDSLMAGLYADIKGRQTVGPATVGANNLFDSNTVYRRGGLTLYALHRQVGDDAFKSIMQTYYQQFGGSTATTEEFITVAESIGGPEVRTLLNRWLYEDELPEQP